jgi:hypothetical protein
MSDTQDGATLGQGGPSGEPAIERAHDHLVDIVNRLIQREMAAGAAAASAAERLTEQHLVVLAGEIVAGHRDRVACLPALARALSGEPALGSKLRSLLDRARVRRRARRGDPGILQALAAIEDELAEQYRDAATTAGFTETERAILALGQAYAENAVYRLRGVLPH